MKEPLPPGLRFYPGYLPPERQERLLAAVRDVVAQAPLFVPQMPRTGKPMSVRMTNCGPLGWVTDKERGYRYQATHPTTGRPWPTMPGILTEMWDALAEHEQPPEACLVNFYEESAKMSLHQDRDEKDLSAPVLSISLGDSCLFRVGGFGRNDPTRSFRLESGDALVIGGESRLRFHGVDRIYPGTSMLLKSGGRINLTMRRVNP